MESPVREKRGPAGESKTGIRRPGPNVWVLLAIFGTLALALFVLPSQGRSTISYSYFIEQIEKDNIESVQLGDQEATGAFLEEPVEPEYRDRNGKLVPGDPKKKLKKNFRVVLPRDGDSRGKLTDLLRNKKIHFENEPQSNALIMFYLLLLVVPIALLAFFWFSFRRTRDQMMGGGFLTGFSKSRAQALRGSGPAGDL